MMARTKISGRKKPVKNQERVIALLQALQRIQAVDITDPELFERLILCEYCLRKQEEQPTKAKMKQASTKAKAPTKSEADASDDDDWSDFEHIGECKKKNFRDSDRRDGSGGAGSAGIVGH